MIGSKAIGTVAYMGGVFAVPELFCWSWGQMVQHNQEMFCQGAEYIHYDRATFSYHQTARNSLAHNMLGDWIVMLDTDHQFEPDIIARMVRLADDNEFDVLSGLYRFKKEPYTPVAYKRNPHLDDRLQPIAVYDKECKAIEIDAAGGGCLFVRRCVFDRIDAELHELPFSQILELSEDHSFFSRCKRLEIRAFLSLQIESEHLTYCPVTSDYEDADWGKLSETIEVEGR